MCTYLSRLSSYYQYWIINTGISLYLLLSVGSESRGAATVEGRSGLGVPESRSILRGGEGKRVGTGDSDLGINLNLVKFDENPTQSLTHCRLGSTNGFILHSYERMGIHGGTVGKGDQ